MRLPRHSKAKRRSIQEAINLKCDAYEKESVRMVRGEEALIIKMCREFGAENVMSWYRIAFGRGIHELKAIKYVCGIARNIRADQEAKNG
jgi:hypothetical protein